MTKSWFLQLPSELILACLESLPFDDLDSCLKCGNRRLADIIHGSVFIQYRHEQKRAGVEETPLASNLAVADRLGYLKDREANWLSFAPRSTHTLPIHFETTGLYDLTSDIYFVGDTADPTSRTCTRIKYICTTPGPESWHTIDVGKPILDFGTALEEHDLIAIITCTPHNDNPRMASVDVSLFKLSTGVPHPLAAHPTLHVHDVEVARGRPGLSIEIVGSTLALSMIYWQFGLRDMDVLYLYDWITGIAKTDSLPVFSTGLVFVTEDILVVPNPIDETLDVLHILQDAEARFLHSFHLPELAPLNSIFTFQCRRSPNPRVSMLRPSSATFLPLPSDTILLFSLHVGNQDGSSDQFFVVHLDRFSAVINLDSDREDLDVEWAEWGPQCTRWLATAELSTHYITTTAGQRMVTIPHDAPQHPAPIRILDFNSATIEAQRARGAVDGPHAAVRVVETSTQSLAAFAELIVSEVPYVEITSKQHFDYGAVLINDANVIGARFGDRTVASLEVLHFG
ncbi:hypothetical protein DFH08DRAFT_42273 [Mycena albidolilacea]|uniref:F-box domain-containing protein n=1 Tax=Mycena albidolilacea TaxID=1033008 RepID=A0AAD7EX88_9AGAR|nr:hypothetical protein DFH08DRAFT_42273 [Mycena albidolilacea]